MSTKQRFSSIGERIEHRMKVLGISRAEAARRSELPVHHFKNIHDARDKPYGTKEPKSVILAAMAKGLDTTEAWLRDEDGPEDRSLLPESVTESIGDSLVEQAQKRAARLAELLADIIRSGPEAQNRSIAVIESELKKIAVSKSQSLARSKGSSSRD